MLGDLPYPRLKTAGIMALAIIVAGIGAGWLGSHVVIAEPAARATAAPVQKPARQRNTLDEKIRTAVQQGVTFLKNAQADGNWEQDPQMKAMPGGVTSLAVLGLLEAGVKADDPVVSKGLDYLRGLKPPQRGIDADGVIDTSFALLFLTKDR